MAPPSAPGTDVALPVPLEALHELGLDDEAIADALDKRPLTQAGRPLDVPGAWFDTAAAAKALGAVRSLRHTKTRRWYGKPLHPEPWQVVWIIAPVFGWKHPDGTRIIREVWVEIPRKNGKSTLSSALALVLWAADGEPGAEVYAAAASKTQANIVLGDAKKMALASPGLRRKLRPLRSTVLAELLRYPATGSILRALSKLADAAHGLSVSGGVIDEIHVHRSRDLIDAITSGTGARDQALIFFLTTADDGDEYSIYAEYHDRVERSAAHTIDDATLWGLIWAASTDDDPFSEETWRKANPGYGVTLEPRDIAAKAGRASTTPSYLPTFKRLSLNLRSKMTLGFLGISDWDGCDARPLAVDLEGRHGYGGLDLSATTDLTAFVLAIPDPDGLHVDVIARFWLPEDRVEELEHRCQVPYTRWAEAGHLTLTEGNVVDYRKVRADILDLIGSYSVAEVGYDPWNATETVSELADAGLTMVPIRQGYASLSIATKRLEQLVLAHRLRHGGHPILRWNAGAAEVRSDDNGNLKPVKPDARKSAKRIDGIVALVMSLDGVIRHAGDTVADDRPAAGGF